MYYKIQKAIKNNQIIEKTLIIFLMIQPLLDLYILFEEEVVDFFGFAPPTIIRILFIGIIGILFLFVIKNKKEIYSYIIYLTIVGIYVVFHHVNAQNFTNFYDGYDFGYGVVSELFYVIRMLMPLFLIIVSSHYKFGLKKVEAIITVFVFSISGSIIVTNILGISTGSYSKKIIKGSIFSWFDANSKLNYMDLASKGFFQDPNRIAALLVLLTPLVFYVLLRNPSVKNKVLAFINMMGMLILGTKVSTYGFIILLVISLIIYLFFVFVKKEVKFKTGTLVYLVLLVCAFGFILPYSPAVNRTSVDEVIVKEYNSNKGGKLEKNQSRIERLYEKIEDIDDQKKREAYMMRFIEKYYDDYSLHYDFVFEFYPYTYDAEFWCYVMGLPLEERTSFRNLEKMMLERVKEKNNNQMDDYLGITFTRMGNIFDLERDFLSHYYTMGIVGMFLLVIPYIVVLLVCMIRMLICHKKCLNMKNVFYLLGSGIVVCAAYFTGNVLDGLIVTLPLGFIMGQLINGVFLINNQTEVEDKIS